MNEDWANVVKTAVFKGDRRIAAAWVPSREDHRDDNGEIFGGNSLFREIVQEADGTLDTRFPPEMLPATGAVLTEKIIPDLFASYGSDHSLVIASPGGVGAAHCTGVPLNARITLEIDPVGANEEYGLYLRSDEKGEGGYRLTFSANHLTCSLGNTTIEGVHGLDKTIKLDIIMKDDIIDVGIDGRRTIVNRVYEQKGSWLWLYAKHGKVRYKSIRISPLSEDK